MRRFLKRIFIREQGITGIETAIILIAFVIVASVFAYVVLSAGLFSTQKAKEAIHAGLEEAKSTIEIKGNIYGKMESSVLTEVYFTVATTTGGDLIDFTDTLSSHYRVIDYHPADDVTFETGDVYISESYVPNLYLDVF